MSYNKVQVLKDNISAIRTAFALTDSNRTATEEELAILQKYSGFGGLKCILSTEPVERWSTADKPLYTLVQELKEVLRMNAATDMQANEYYQSLKNSVMTAFYTPEPLVKTIGQQIEKSTGGKIKTVLDPSCGNGVFLGFSQKGEKTAYEKDLLTGLILSAQHPETDVRIEGFENLPEEDNNRFDVVVSNIPFGTIKVFDRAYQKGEDPVKASSTNAIHNYFFVKGLDAAREGGLVAFITTRGIADSASNREIRKYLMENSHLVSCIRLTDDLFMDTGGIEVGSDLIILQKETGKGYSTYDESLFIGSMEDNTLTKNSYINNPVDRHYLGTPYRSTNQFGERTVKFKADADTYSHSIQKLLERDFTMNFRLDLYEKNIEKQAAPSTETVAEAVNGEPLVSLNDLFGLPAQNEHREIKEKNIIRRKIKTDTSVIERDWLRGHYRQGTYVMYNGEVGTMDISQKGITHFVLDTTLSPAETDMMEKYINVRDSYYKLFDWEKFNLLQNKQVFISQLKSKQLGVRSLDEGALDEKSGMNFAEYVAILSGNTDLLTKAKLDKKIVQLQKERVLFYRDKNNAERTLEKLIGKKEATIKAVADMKEDFRLYSASAASKDFVAADGTTIYGKEIGKYLNAWRSRKGNENASIHVGTYRNHAIFMKTISDVNHFGIVGTSGREYQSPIALPLSYDQCPEWLENLGSSLSDRAEKLEAGIPVFEHDIAELKSKLDNRVWAKEQQLTELKKEAAVLNEKINDELNKNKGNNFHIEANRRILDVQGEKITLTVMSDGSRHDLSEQFKQLLDKEGMSVSELTQENFETLVKGGTLTVNKSSLTLAKDVSGYTIKANNASNPGSIPELTKD